MLSEQWIGNSNFSNSPEYNRHVAVDQGGQMSVWIGRSPRMCRKLTNVTSRGSSKEVVGLSEASSGLWAGRI